MGLSKAKLRKELLSRGANEESIEYYIKGLVELNNAVKNGDDIWAEGTEKNNSYFQLYYCVKDNGKLRRKKLWVPCLMDDTPKETAKYWFKYCFKSGAYGMDRRFAAIDHVFSLLKKCGGEYSQAYCN